MKPGVTGKELERSHCLCKNEKSLFDIVSQKLAWREVFIALLALQVRGFGECFCIKRSFCFCRLDIALFELIMREIRLSTGIC